MGRAIVREPAAFLMDEPLSNLDAKLRVQMRAEIAGLQRDLGVTTIYVTHDQVEAMTMGDRVAVMRKGELQQVDRSAGALRPSGQPVRRRLHRQPGDEHGRGDARAAERRLRRRGSATSRSPSTAETLAARPALAAYAGRTVVLGIRPEDLEDAALATDTPADRRLRGTVELTEALGSEIMVHFAIEAKPAVTEDVRELAQDVGDERAASAARRGRDGDARRPLRRRARRPRRARRSRSPSTPAPCTSSTPRPGSGSTTEQQ